MEEFCKSSGISPEQVIDLSASINPLGMPPGAKKAIKGNIALLANYPEPYCKGLAQRLGERLGIAPESILPANGSTELIYLIPRALRPEKVLIHNPTFSEYERASALAGAKIASLRNISFKKEDFLDGMRKADLAFLCNPNNPTGELLKKKTILEIAVWAKKAKCVLVIDEAFMDFCPEHSVIQLAERNPWLIVLRSMTKFHALTGLRVGYGVCHSGLAQRLFRHKEPWCVNTLAVKSAIAALDDGLFARRSLVLIKRERAFVESGLERLGVWFFKGAANFYLIKLKGAKRFSAGLKKSGVLVRDCSNFPGLSGDYLRFAVKRRSENEFLLKELSTFLSCKKEKH